ncbi:MAG TPA: HAD hydrolase family protein [Burkholderiales bacterium]
MLTPPLLRPAFAMPEAALERARRVRLLLLDVDGVLTDGRVILGPADEYKAFDIKDGHGIRLLIENGITIGIVTGRTSRAVERRAAELGVRHLYQGCGEKLPVCAALVRELGLAREQAAYVGDDVVDLPVMLHLGLGIAVRDAHPLVREHADWVTPSAGGRGAVREAAELILHAQQKYAAAMRRYLAADAPR